MEYLQRIAAITLGASLTLGLGFCIASTGILNLALAIALASLIAIGAIAFVSYRLEAVPAKEARELIRKYYS